MGLSLLSLAIFAYPFGSRALIGVIGSIGVSINAAIITMTALQAHDSAAKGNLFAVHSEVVGCGRHIVSTTVTTFCGFLAMNNHREKFMPGVELDYLMESNASTFFDRSLRAN